MTHLLHKTIVQFVLFLCFILVATEPECSKYSYEEQLLAKMIRVEFKLEQIDEKTTKVRENIHEALKVMQQEMTNFKKEWSDEKAELKKAADIQKSKSDAILQTILSEHSELKEELRNQRNATIGMFHFHPHDCMDVLNAQSQRKSGIYTVHPLGSTAFDVYCDMETDGGGWTVFQNRFEGSVDFHRNFTQYETGFGLLTTEFWLGLQKVYAMTKGKVNVLRLDVMDAAGKSAYESFQDFSLSSSPGYNLRIGNIRNTTMTSDAHPASRHNGMPFSTYDVDRDGDSGNCASDYEGGWWYDGCFHVNLNGPYGRPGAQTTTGIVYRNFRPSTSLKRSKMMFKRDSHGN